MKSEQDSFKLREKLMTGPQPRNGIMDLPPYIGGKESMPGQKKYLNSRRMKTHLARVPMPKAYHMAGENLEIYPDGIGVSSRGIVKAHKLDMNKIVCGFGSDELLQIMATAYLQPGDEAIHTEHGFLVYKLPFRQRGRPVSVAETKLTADVDASLDAVNDKTKIIFLANPNNPTGTMISASEVRRLHAGLQENVLLVLDGAYAEYVLTTDYEDGFALVEETQNVVTTRTFSKIYGLAALRLGWAYCPAPIAAVINRLRGPFNVSTPAQLAGIAAIEDQAHVQASIKHNDEWRDRLFQQISGAGFEVLPSHANFLLIKFDPENGLSAAQAEQKLNERGLILRGLTAYGLPNALRLTIGTEEANQLVIEVFQEMAGNNG